MLAGQFNNKFPDLFSEIGVPPEGAHEENILVFRALPTGNVDEGSFLPTYIEEYGSYENMPDEKKLDPAEFSVSTYEKLKDIKRFAVMTSYLKVPYKIAKGVTAVECGLVLRDTEIKDGKKKKSSHINWWLYENAKPHVYFEVIPDFKSYLEENTKKEV